jgi:putative DNA primase/helicase
MINDFLDAMRAAGLNPPSDIEPGKLHRFPGIGKSNGNTAGWCKLFDDGLGGVFGDWATALSETWQAKREKPFSPIEQEAFSREVAESQRQATEASKARRDEAAGRAAEVWEAATPAGNQHPYLLKKGIQAHGLRIHDKRLVVPLRDVGGNLRSVQFIAPDGDKRYLTGGAITGNHWTAGTLTPETPYLCVCEGAATAATVHEATGTVTVAAMSTGNLKAVAEALQTKYPGTRIIVCGDDDYQTEGNPGQKAATDAACAVGGIVAMPQFPTPRDPEATDFNDLARIAGRAAVKQQIDDLLTVVDQFETPPQSDSKSSNSEDKRVVAELARLWPMDYDRQRTAFAKQLGVRTPTLDKLVAEERERLAVDDELDGVVEELQPWGSPVDGRELANQIARTLANHVALPDGAATAIALFALGTYAMDAWRLWPKLLITSPEKRCGKSTLLEAIEAVTHRPMLTASITASALFRGIQEWQPTLLIDEADTFAAASDELNGVLNAGHTKRTAVVIRSEKDGDGFKPKKFSVWCPQVIAGIKSQRDTLHDRSIQIQMRRKLPGESVKKLPHDLFEKLKPLRRHAVRWAKDNLDGLKSCEPEVPNFGNDRQVDNWSPLYAVAQVIGGDWPERVRSAYQVLVGNADDDDAIGPMILGDIRKIFDELGKDTIHSEILVQELIELEDRPWSEWRRGREMSKNSLARLLKPFGVRTHQIKIGGTNKYGYRRSDFADTWARYLGAASNTPVQNATTLQRSDGAGFSDF